MYYQPPLEDLRFLLETFDYEANVQSLDHFADFDLETAMGLIEAYSEFCMEVLAPLLAIVMMSSTRSTLANSCWSIFPSPDLSMKSSSVSHAAYEMSPRVSPV